MSGVTVNISEGGAGLRGRITLAEGQQAPPNLRVDLIPAEKESAENVLRFFETRADSDGSFVIGNIAPRRYWIIERAVDENDSATAKSLRQDALLRSQLLKAATTRKEIQFQPCQRLLDYELPYAPVLVETKSKP